MKIDVHNHIGYDPANDEQRSEDELLREMSTAEVDLCGYSPLPRIPI